MPTPKRSHPGRDRRGAMVILILITLVIFIAAAAFSINVAYMQLTRTELRTSTDAGARAAVATLAQGGTTDDATVVARQATQLNPVAGEPLLLDDADIVFGRSQQGGDEAFDFEVGGIPANSARVTGRRTADSPSGTVGLPFSRIFDASTFAPKSVARAVHLQRDFCVVIDRSGSMSHTVTGIRGPYGLSVCNGPHATESRWSALRYSVIRFLNVLGRTDDDELVSLVTYSADESSKCGGIVIPATRIDVPLVEAYRPIKARMNLYSRNDQGGPAMTDFRVAGRTNIAAGIRAGIAALTGPARRTNSSPVLVVLTDGKANQPIDEAFAVAEAYRAAHEAVAALPGLQLETITFSDEAEQATMQEIARIGSGFHHHAPDDDALDEIFREIAVRNAVVMAE